MGPNIHQLVATDVLVIGGGAAGLRAAIEARREGARVVILAKSKIGTANNSAISYGGFAAVKLGDESLDSPDIHYEDTLKGGCGLNQPFLVRFLVNRVWAEVEALEEMGVKFQKEPDGRYRRFSRGGHSFPRRLATFWNSGMALLSPLSAYARQLGVTMVDCFKVVHLLQQRGQICGDLGMSSKGEWLSAAAKAVVLATGGGGALYPVHDNIPTATGSGYAVAYDPRLMLQDMEFIQFNLRCAREPGIPGRMPPVEELLLKGATLCNFQGENLFKELGSKIRRDHLCWVGAQEISRQNGEGHGVYLNLKTLPGEVIAQNPMLRKDAVKINTEPIFLCVESRWTGIFPLPSPACM